MLFAAAAALASASSPAAAAFGGSDAGTAGAAFLKLPVGARAPAMGEAYGAVADDAAALHYNPAGLALLERRSAVFSHNEHLAFFRHEFLAYAHPLAERGTLAGSFTLLTQDPVARVDNTGREAGGSFAPSDLAFSAAYARAAGPWCFGANLEYVSQTLDDESAAGFAADLGALRRLGAFTAGLAVTGLGPDLRFRTAGDPLPLALRLSGAWRGGPALLAAEAVAPRDGGPALRLGGEWRLAAGPDSSWAARAGYRTDTIGGLGALSGLSLGVGLRLGRWDVDFAFLPYGALGRSYRLGMGFRF